MSGAWPEEFVWRDLAWPERHPAARVEPVEDGTPSGDVLTIPLGPGSVLGVRPLGADEHASRGPRASRTLAGRWCQGRSVAAFDENGAPVFRRVSCPERRRIRTGRQCPACRAADDFAPLHRVHRGAVLAPAAAAYAALPHWLYVATFPDGSAKVGTAHERSKISRPDQQAVARADWVALARNGTVVRELEDGVSSSGLGLVQAKRAEAKARAWCSPLPAAELAGIHQRLADEVRGLLEGWSGEDFEVVRDAWQPSTAMNQAYASLRVPAGSPGSLRPAEAEAPEGVAVHVLSAAAPFVVGHRGDPDAPELVDTSRWRDRAFRRLDAVLPDASGRQDGLF